jgi:hypothetical protein
MYGMGSSAVEHHTSLDSVKSIRCAYYQMNLSYKSQCSCVSSVEVIHLEKLNGAKALKRRVTAAAWSSDTASAPPSRLQGRLPQTAERLHFIDFRVLIEGFALKLLTGCHSRHKQFPHINHHG